MSDEQKSNVGLYLGALVILALLEVTFALGINALRPDQDNTALIMMVGVVLVPLMTGILNAISAERARTEAREAKRLASETHDLVNGQSQKLERLTRAEGFAEGAGAAIAALPEKVEIIQPPGNPVPVTQDKAKKSTP